jgi:hypothetical protein
MKIETAGGKFRHKFMFRGKHVLIIASMLVIGGCRKSIPIAATPSQAPGTSAPLRSYLDLEPGWRLTVITPMRKDKGDLDWKYGQPNTKTITTQNGAAANIDVTIQLDPTTLFGFERSVFAVAANGLQWRESVRNLNGSETNAAAPLLDIFGGKPRKQRMRLLFLTRGSDLNYNMALLRAGDAKAMDALTQHVRQAPETACAGDCVWIPPGVAARAEKPTGAGGWAPVL